MVRISDSSLVTEGDGRHFVVYHIRVHCPGAQPPYWTIYRRYAEFDALSVALRTVKPPQLPPKRFFGKLSPTFIVFIHSFILRGASFILQFSLALEG